MHTDERGHAMTTGSAEAAAALDGAIHNFVHWKAAVMPGLKGALEADAGFALAHAVNGLVLHGARATAFRPMIEGSLAAAHAAEGEATERERLYVAALDDAAAGRIAQSVTRYEAILGLHPTDLLAQRLAQMELFWIGEMAGRRIFRTAWPTHGATPSRATASSSRAAPSTSRRRTVSARPNGSPAAPSRSIRKTSGAPMPWPM